MVSKTLYPTFEPCCLLSSLHLALLSVLANHVFKVISSIALVDAPIHPGLHHIFLYSFFYVLNIVAVLKFKVAADEGTNTLRKLNSEECKRCFKFGTTLFTRKVGRFCQVNKITC